MAHVVTDRCVDCRYTDCCAVCPVECFWEVTKPAMLVIDPNVCIDCAQCIPECPIYAIYPEAELPDVYKEWTKKNAELYSKGVQITAKKDSLPSAIPLEAIQAREKAKGWKVAEPSAVAGGKPAGGAKKESKPKKETAAAGAEVGSMDPKDVAAATLKKKLAELGIQTGEAPATGPAGYRPAPLRMPKPVKRPDLGVNVGGKVKIGFRTAVIEEFRRGQKGIHTDVKIRYEGDTKPTFVLYTALQTALEKGQFQVLNPGPKPGLLARLLSR